MKINIKRQIKKMKLFALREIKETIFISKLAFKIDKTKEEKEFVKIQRREVLQVVCLAPIFLLPFGTTTVLLIVKKGKKIGINIKFTKLKIKG